MSTKKKAIKFRVYPDSVHGHYLDVEIHPTIEAMRKAASRTEYKTKGQRDDFGDALAAVLGYGTGYISEQGRKVWSKTLGTIFFHRDQLGMEVVTHEATHAAIRWAEQQKIKIDFVAQGGRASDAEERFCGALGRISAQIASKCHELDLYV